MSLHVVARLGENMQRCPVCGTPVYEEDKRIMTRHNGVQYFFDTQEHREEFEQTPGRYTGRKPEARTGG